VDDIVDRLADEDARGKGRAEEVVAIRCGAATAGDMAEGLRIVEADGEFAHGKDAGGVG